jgi:exosome complex RNA-binding protein Rrp42 (RNase PH superfamily)
MSELCMRHRRFYALYFKEDSEKTEVAVGDSISEVVADVQARTGRPFPDFQFREISRSEFESLSPMREG